MNGDKFQEMLKFAIEQEIEAANFYHEMQNHSKFKPSKEMFKELEAMELGHKKLLENFSKNELNGFVPPHITDLHISDYLYEPPVSSGMLYQEVLIIAMKKEENAQKLYTDLANKAEDNTTKNFFLKLASEEAKHKFQLETLYDEVINSEN